MDSGSVKCACRSGGVGVCMQCYLQRRPCEEPRRRSRQRRIDGCPQPAVAGSSNLPERSCATYLNLHQAVKELPASLMEFHVRRTHLRHANEQHTKQVSGWARNVQCRARKIGGMAARWHGTTRSRSSLALSMAGQSVGAENQWFETTTHTFNPNCASAAGDANSAALGRPALASQEELRNELSDLVSGRCETRQ
jgi:hypothetical protein